MNISYQNLDQVLKKHKEELASFYLISGDEQLLVTEARDQINERAIKLKYQRHHFDLNEKVKWQDVNNAWRSYGLFAAPRLIELNIPALSKIKKGYGLSFMENLRPLAAVTVVLIVPASKKSDKKPKWLSGLESQAHNIKIANIAYGRLVQFISARAQKLKLKLHRDAITLLQQNYEGNLVALHQELQKLRLLYQDEHVGVEQVRELIISNSRHNIFQALDAALLGDAERCLQIIDFLRDQRVAIEPLIASCARDLRAIRRLMACKDSQQRGRVLFASGVPAFRHDIVTQTSYRLNMATTDRLFALCGQLDRSKKGVDKGNHYDLLTRVLLGIAGYSF